MKRIRASYKASLFTLMSLAFMMIATGCLGPLKTCFYIDSIRIKVDSDANNFSATEVDLVVVYDETILKEILGLSADKYFAKSQQLKRDYPEQLDIFHWEVVPGQILFSESLNYRKSCPPGAVVFARYIAKGEHRIRLGQDRHIEVHLKKNNFCIRPLAGKDTPEPTVTYTSPCSTIVEKDTLKPYEDCNLPRNMTVSESTSVPIEACNLPCNPQ